MSYAREVRACFLDTPFRSKTSWDYEHRNDGFQTSAALK